MTWEHRLLPPDAIRLLKTAAQTELEPDSNKPSFEREKAIDTAYFQLRMRWPNLFRE